MAFGGSHSVSLAQWKGFWSTFWELSANTSVRKVLALALSANLKNFVRLSPLT